jgi:bla regulator protein blaR1
MTGWMLETLIATTLLMAAVLALRGPVRRAFGAQVAYALWALPALRLMLPPVPAAWREAAATPISQAGETVTVLILPATEAVAQAPVAAASPFPIGLALAALWAVGAGGFLIWHLLQHRRFCRNLLAHATLLDQREGIRVIASDAATGPLAFGIRRRYVAFPRDFGERYDRYEQALALDHELGHHARGDLLANWIALLVLALHWFNPLAWRAFHAFRADQELANDARVLAGRSRADRHVYACAIVKAAHGGAVSAACHLHTIEDLKGRLKMLTVSRTSRRRLATGAATVGVLGMLGLGLTVSGSQAAAAISDKVEAAVDRQVPPPPPPAPPAPAAANAPPAPPAPPAPAARTAKRVVVVKDGETKVYEGKDADTYLADNDLPVPPTPPVPPVAREGDVFRVFSRRVGPDGKPTAFAWAGGPAGKFNWENMPAVISTRCKGDKGPTTETRDKGGKKRITICTNRIEAMTKNAELQALHAEGLARNAQVLALRAETMEAHVRGTARASLGMARSAIERDRALSEAQRAQALAGIAQAEAELAAEAK